MTLAADVEGIGPLLSSLDAAAAALDPIEGDPVGDLLVAAALPRTPYRTGRLASTVRAATSGELVVLAAGGPGVGYAGPVHARDPWLADTIAAQADRVAAEVTAQLEAAVDLIHT